MSDRVQNNSLDHLCKLHLGQSFQEWTKQNLWKTADNLEFR